MRAAIAIAAVSLAGLSGAAEAEDGIPVKSPLVEAACGSCHATDDAGRMSRISWQRKSAEGWQITVIRMIRTGNISLSAEEARDVVRYLTDNHGLAPEEERPYFYLAEQRPHQETFAEDEALLRQEAVDSLKTLLVPLALVVTPNIPEAETLTGMKIETGEDMREAARQIVALGARAVVVKGGHLSGPATDLLYDGSEFTEFTSERFDTANTHGTGCTFASAAAAGLAQGKSVLNAVAQAKEFVTGAIRNSYPLGQGHGPVHHFYRFWTG